LKSPVKAGWRGSLLSLPSFFKGATPILGLDARGQFTMISIKKKRFPGNVGSGTHRRIRHNVAPTCSSAWKCFG